MLLQRHLPATSILPSTRTPSATRAAAASHGTRAVASISNEDLVFGAGLDVFEIEPPEKSNPLLKNDKVFLSPHTAAFTEECMIRMGKETIQNIIDFFDNKIEKSKTVKL